MKESARYILPILVFVALVLTIGTCGYLVIEDGITVSDAFYMAVTAITPTQFDEVHKLSVRGRYFTVALVFCGFGAVVAFATQFARWIVQSELEGVGVITRKQMSRRIRRMKDHYIVCGYGEIGGAICGQLKEEQLPFVVIADDEPSITSITRLGYALVRGNPTADSSLKEAGVERAVGVIAVLADDSDNLFISLAARELNPKILIIARGEDSSIEDRILRAGADIVVSPMKLGGRQIAELIKQQTGSSPRVNALTSQSSVMGLHLAVHRQTSENPITVAEVIAQTESVGAAGIQRSDGSFEAAPPADAIVGPDDALVLITRADDTGISIQHNSTGKTILLVDDHRALRLLFTRKLASVGHDVIQAATGEEGLRLARLHPPDLIVLDVNMPGRSGYEVCEELRRQKDFADVPIILYSGDETDEFIERGRACGADICIRKTSKSSELLARIDEAFARKVSVQSDIEKTEESAEDKSSAKASFDLDVAMQNVNGDRQLLGELVSIVLEETPRLMERIRVSIEEPDPEGLRIAAHTLKGSVEILGAGDTSAAAAKLESLGRDGDLERIAPLHTELQRQVDTLMHDLERHHNHDLA